jgi:hypothetical protein
MLAVVLAVASLASPADAIQKWDWEKGVASDSTAFRTVRTCNHAYGNIGIRQTYGTNHAAGFYRLYNPVYRKSTTAKGTSSGGLVEWRGVVAGTHTMQVRRIYLSDTNGLAPGSGVTTFRGRYSCPSP